MQSVLERYDDRKKIDAPAGAVSHLRRRALRPSLCARRRGDRGSARRYPGGRRQRARLHLRRDVRPARRATHRDGAYAVALDGLRLRQRRRVPALRSGDRADRRPPARPAAERRRPPTSSISSASMRGRATIWAWSAKCSPACFTSPTSISGRDPIVFRIRRRKPVRKLGQLGDRPFQRTVEPDGLHARGGYPDGLLCLCVDDDMRRGAPN